MLHLLDKILKYSNNLLYKLLSSITNPVTACNFAATDFVTLGVIAMLQVVLQADLSGKALQAH